MVSPMLVLANRWLMDLLTTISRCPGVNQRPATIFTFGRISNPVGDKKRMVTLVSPVPSFRGRTMTRISSPETRFSPLASRASPGKSRSTCMASRSTPPAANSEFEPFRSTNTLFGSPVVANASRNPASRAIMKITIVTVRAMPRAVITVAPLRNRRFLML